jgi:hypothetical protein
MTSTRGRIRLLPLMLAAAVGLALVPIARAQTLQRDRQNDGIRINGHWVIHILNRDGTVAERREFDNALTSSGAAILAKVLTRTNGVARWTIQLGGFTGGPCAGGTYGPSTVVATNSCFITDRAATPPLAGTAVFPTLTAAIGGPNNDQIVLSGNATAAAAGEIDYVATVQSLCASTIAGCNVPAYNDQFTSHDLRDTQGVLTPVLVTAGQIVQVTVTISFCNSTECL